MNSQLKISQTLDKGLVSKYALIILLQLVFCNSGVINNLHKSSIKVAYARGANIKELASEGKQYHMRHKILPHDSVIYRPPIYPH